MIKKAIISLIFPFLFGAIIGIFSNKIPIIAQEQAQKALFGICNFELFNICGITGVLIVSIYVIIYGEIIHPLSYTKKLILYGLPSISFGACVPFFVGLGGFFLGSPSNQEKINLIALSIIGFMWSAGSLAILLAPAHNGIIPLDTRKKRILYVMIIVLTVTTIFWRYFA